MFPWSTLLAGPKHSTSVPFSVGSAVPLSVDVNEVAVIPNPVPDLAMKTLPGPQIDDADDLCARIHWLLPPTPQVVTPLMSPVTVHLKVNVSPGQVGGAAVSCPVASSEEIYCCHNINLHHRSMYEDVWW